MCAKETRTPPTRNVGFALEMDRDAALGNGTRKRGERLARILPEPGVTMDELATVLRSHHLMRIVPD